VAEIVRPESFWPAPKVESAILKIVLDKPPHLMNVAIGAQGSEKFVRCGGEKPAQEGSELKDFWRLVKIGFSSRRKTLANNLAAGYHIKPDGARDLLKSLGFSDKTRAQELSVEDWLKLAKKPIS